MFIRLLFCLFFIQTAMAAPAVTNPDESIRLTIPGPGESGYDLKINNYALPKEIRAQSLEAPCWITISILPGNFKGTYTTEIDPSDECTTIADAIRQWHFYPGNDWSNQPSPPPLRLKLLANANSGETQIAIPNDMLAWRTQLPKSVHGYDKIEPKKRTAPRYPNSAKKEGLQATCGVKFSISDKGKVESVRLVEGDTFRNDVTQRIATHDCPEAFHGSVVEAANRWTFKPLRINSEGVASDYTLSFRFKIH